MTIVAYMMSCDQRELARAQTLDSLRRSDWGVEPYIEIDATRLDRPQERQEHTALRLLEQAARDRPEAILVLEDDLEFNRHLRHNLERWYPLQSVRADDYFLGSLYNPGVLPLQRDVERAFLVAHADAVYGSQAFILSLATVRYIVAHWWEVAGMQDIKVSRLAARVCPVYYHVPSLVQHLGVTSVWGGRYHRANDYDAAWKT